MINHLRTLLLNRPGGAQDLNGLGEEYIPVEFGGQVLTGWRRSYWTGLFGSAPDNTYLNYQLSKLLRVVHATDYAEYVNYFDPRVTYDPRAATDFDTLQYGLTYTSSAASSPIVVTPVGELVADAGLGRMRWHWQVQLVDGYATITEMQSQNSVSVQALTFSNVSAPLPLPANNTLRITLQAESTDSADWNGVYDVIALGRPSTDISTIIANLVTARGNERELFGGLVNEPYRTFAQLWQQETVPSRVTGLVLALAFRLHESYAALIAPGALTTPAAVQPVGDGEVWPEKDQLDGETDQWTTTEALDLQP